MTKNDNLTVGLAQLSSVWLNKKLTSQKIVASIEDAANKSCQLVVFSEAMLPGYPFWIGLADHGSGITTEGDELGLSPGNSDNPDDWSHH